MLKLLQSLGNKFYDVEVIYRNVYRHIMVDCRLLCRRKSPIGVLSVGNSKNVKTVINNAIKLLDDVFYIQGKLGDISMPTYEDQPWVNGYHRIMISDDTEIEFQRIDSKTFGKFVITAISKKDKNGFYFLSKPLTIEKFTEKYYPIQKVANLLDAEKKYVNNDELLYCWNDIRPLSGTSGYLIIKNGKVIKSRTECIA